MQSYLPDISLILLKIKCSIFQRQIAPSTFLASVQNSWVQVLQVPSAGRYRSIEFWNFFQVRTGSVEQ